MENPDYSELALAIDTWAKALGFQQVGISDTDLGTHEDRLDAWLARGFAADMDYMSRHGSKRSQPDALIPGTIRIISVRMDYLPAAEGRGYKPRTREGLRRQIRLRARLP